MAEKTPDATPSESSSSPKKEEPSTGNWWDSWITSAKSKSAEVYTMVRKDLDELGCAVRSEATHVLTSTSSAIGKTLKLDEPESPANVMKKSFSTFIGQVSTVLNPEPDDEDDTEVILSSGDTTMLSTYKKELETLQRVDATFIVPADSAEFDAWKSSLESDVISPSSASRRLAQSPTLAAQYEKLVPDACTNEQFWERYLFRVALLQDRLAAAARRRDAPSTDPVMAHLPLQSETPVIDESPKMTISPEDTESSELEEPLTAEIDNAVAWEHEDFAHDVELTEEQQILLLEEYEKEIASKKLTKQTSTKDIANNNSKNKTTNTKSGNAKSQSRDKQNNKATDKKKKQNAGKKSNDDCGNNLVEDYFGDKDVPKDDASANSDESWEKEFEIDDVEKIEKKA
ncbi:hypothetical protein JYU34_015287 [Plutella xylostella]|uniref:BSD domain-containing protein n=1 Tax=Plutella xylostella TaxID=51655 RepID=A0ABQ7Q6Q4_PLUXY|nr:hypothetical protein JYU34_015287 [Plutella xylostella]